MSDVAEPTREGSKAGERICWKCGETYGSHLQYCPEDGSQLVELDPTDEGDLLVGTVFDDRFRIMSVLGEGGMSRVYHARKVDNEEHVALKILKADFLRDEEIRKRFMYEARVIAGLDHPAAVDLHDFGQAPDGSFYMVMELLEGESLANRLRRRFITYDEIFAFTIPTCGVMAEAHRDDVIHRDLKPENIYLTHIEHETDQPKLLDFGIAKHLRMGTMTQSDARWGTPAYMSPEQASGDPVQGTADIYALGVMLYELVAGILPFRASTAMGFAVKHMHKDVRPIGELPGMGDVVPRELDELIVEMMEKEPEDRPESMENVQRRLEAVRDSEMIGDLRGTTPGEQLDRDSIDLSPEDADDGSGEGGVQVNEELKSAHTVFVGEDEEGTPVEGDVVANLHEADGRGPSNQLELSPNAPTPTDEIDRQTLGDDPAVDTAELSGQWFEGKRAWWMVGAALVGGGILTYVVISAVLTSRPGDPGGEGTASKAMMFEHRDTGISAREQIERSASNTSEAVGKGASLAARTAMRARTIALRVGGEVQAMPEPVERSGGRSPSRLRRAPSNPPERSAKPGESSHTAGESDEEDATSDESVQEALEATF